MKYKVDVKTNTITLSLLIAFIIGLSIGKITEEKTYYHEKEFLEFEDYDAFGNANNPVTAIETEFNYSNALVAGIITFGTLLVLSGIKKEENN